MHSANSLPLLIIAVPCLLAVYAAKKAQKQQTPTPKIERVEAFQWPKLRARRVAKTGER